MTTEWRRKKDNWRRLFKEKISEEETHHHRGRGREETRNFMSQMRYEL